MNYTIIFTQNCNLNCLYCYEKNKNRKEKMNNQSLGQTVNLIINEYAKKPSEVASVSICGGEPILAYENIKYFMLRMKENTESRGLKPVSYELSTNGTILNIDIIQFLKDFNVSYYIGFDGIKESFNKNRIFYTANSGAFENVYANIMNLLKEGIRPEMITLNMVISANNVKYLNDSILFISNIDANIKPSINIAYNSNWDAVSLNNFDFQLTGLFEFYKVMLKNNIDYSIKFIDQRIQRILFPRKYNSNNCGAANSCCTILTNGDIIGCSSMAYNNKENDNIIIGNIRNGIDQNKKEIFRKKLDSIDLIDCKDCEFNEMCMNYCAAFNMNGSGDLTEIPESICETEKRLITQAMDFIDKLNRENPELLRLKYGLN